MSRRGTYFASKGQKHSDMVTLLSAREKKEGISPIMIDKKRKDSTHKYIFRPTIMREVIAEKEVSNTLVFFPDPPTFGVICQGFKWQLTCRIGNAGLVPERMKVTCIEKNGDNLVDNKIHCSYKPVRLAAGMKTDIVLTIDAEKLGISECELRVFEVSTRTELIRSIRASVIAPKMYKELRAKLVSQGKRIMSPGVIGIGQELSSKEFLCDSKMSDDERNDVLQMPYVDGVYYDPWEKRLCTDQMLMNVVVNTGNTRQDSIDMTEEMRKLRFEELESQGFYTTHAVALAKSADNVDEEEVEQYEGNFLQPIIEEDSISVKSEEKCKVPPRRVTGAYMKKYSDMSETVDSMKTTVRR